jgi:glyoxylase-like metal-dependent hydrolase (beta-lactamase superfamily II)/rhodanese-related sulfurtransferase
VCITHVLETHLHNDFLSGSRELASLAGARITASAGAGLEFDHHPVREGDVIPLGEVRISVVATPGHTPEHVSYLARDTSRPTDPPVLFSGGSLLVGAVSRTDLLGHDHATGLTHELYRSLHEKILPLGDEVVVYPTHGAGSFCTAAASAESTTTIGRERRTNLFLTESSPDAFAARLESSMPSYPKYFQHMRALNKRGPRIIGGVPRLAPLTAIDVHARQQRGQAVVDIRSIHDYARAHIPGVFHVELRAAFSSWVGWVVPFGTPVILVAETELVHEYAVRQLIRIGYDELPGYLEGGMEAWINAGLPIETTVKLTMRELRERLQHFLRNNGRMSRTKLGMCTLPPHPLPLAIVTRERLVFDAVRVDATVSQDGAHGVNHRAWSGHEEKGSVQIAHVLLDRSTGNSTRWALPAGSRPGQRVDHVELRPMGAQTINVGAEGNVLGRVRVQQHCAERGCSARNVAED